MLTIGRYAKCILGLSTVEDFMEKTFTDIVFLRRCSAHHSRPYSNLSQRCTYVSIYNTVELTIAHKQVGLLSLA
jgi:hypothetical protein